MNTTHVLARANVSGCVVVGGQMWAGGGMCMCTHTHTHICVSM